MAGASHELTMAELRTNRPFEPTAATSSMFLYAQGSTIVCCHHDSLAVERYFSRHAEEVQLLVVDNQSEHGRGRLVASYDAGMTAIVWDIMTGEEVTRFVSFEPLTAATWMRNGNIAFGNVSGSITLFEPPTAEHISARTLDQIAITAIAPASDCRTFAIGYQNGSLLIATLQPRFTILHNLSTSRGPSPIITLAWHASASRQRSDMLASQTRDGDLRVWSVAKSYSSDDPAKVVRILKRTENNVEGPSWMGWSKNGRIIEYSDGQTVSWDVRTKHVTYDQIPTLEDVRGLAVYGPGAKLFTLGDSATVQQFDLNTPSILMANIQHANALPPSPPVSVEEQNKSLPSIRSDETVPTAEIHVTSSDEEQAIMRNRDLLSASDRYDTSSTSSQSDSSARGGGRAPERHASMISRAQTDITYISNTASSMRSHLQQSQQQPQQPMHGGYRDRDMFSTSTRSFSSKSSTGTKPPRGSRLRNDISSRHKVVEVDAKDLFKFTRARLSDMSYKLPAPPNSARLTNDDLRRQMLSTIFGWNGEIDELIHDERSRHPSGSSSKMLLSKWLGEEDTEMFQHYSENMSNSDWMLLALGGMGPQSPQSKIGRAYVQRLLGDGDVHAAVTIMLCLGDHNDAIEIYVSHRKYMEALILTCFSFPAVWERQTAIIRKWGEYSIQHGQQQLAIRCFACTDQESSEPWASPSAMQLNFEHNNGAQHSIPEVLSPPLSPPSNTFGSPRSGKPSALKLITSFGSGAPKAKFFNDGQTPIAAGITPIAESAISPGGFDPSTAFLRPSHNSRFNTPITARPSDRFPSIGESLRDKKKAEGVSADHLAPPPTIQEDANLPSPDSNILVKMQESRAGSNGPRERMPLGLKLQLQPQDSGDVASPSSGSNRFHWPSRRRGPGSVSSSVTGGSLASGSALNSGLKTGRSNVSGRSVDDYINSLDAAKAAAVKAHTRQDSRGRRREPSQDGGHEGARERSEDRGRPMDRAWNKPKLSPTSPIPMSPQDLEKLSARDATNTPQPSEPGNARRTPKPSSRASSRHRGEDSRTPLRVETRGRGNAREGSATRSPSSPVPMNAHFDGSEDEADYLKAVEDQENFRRKRSASRARDGRGTPSNAGARQRSQSGNGGGNVSTSIGDRVRSTERVGDLRKMKDERQRKKEAAARELEERRKSLAQRTMMPPHALNPGTTSESDMMSQDEQQPSPPLPPVPTLTHSSSTSPQQRKGMFSPRSGSGPLLGLPATPRAMRLIINPDIKQMPTKPGIPASLVQQQQQQQQQHNSASPGAASDLSPEERPVAQAPELLTLLPSTVYQPPPRSMSAPIPEPTLPRYASPGQSSTPGGTPAPAISTAASRVARGQAIRKASAPDVVPHPLQNQTRRPSYSSDRRPSHDDRERPPFVKELQHLASPPPPPPMPFYQAHKGSRSVIEVFRDDEGAAPVVIERIPDQLQSQPQYQYQPQPQPQSPEAVVPHTVIPRPPSATSNKASHGHSRGRSLSGFGADSISSKFSRATTRLRSQSRNRKQSTDASAGAAAVPRGEMQASPYESIPPFMVQSTSSRSPAQVGAQGYNTGLSRSEMI